MSVLQAPTLVNENKTRRESVLHDEPGPGELEQYITRLLEADPEQQMTMLMELELPAEDGIPMETNWHRIAMNLLIDSVHAFWRDRNDYFVGGNMFIYFNLEQVLRRDYRGPDFFVVKDVDGTRDRESWIVWKEGGRYPNVILELASSSTIQTDLVVKKQIYEQVFRTPEYFCYDPDEHRLLGWQLAHNEYSELQPNAQGWLWSQELNVWVGTWEGQFQRVHAVWPRFYTAEGQLVLTLAEAEAHRAEAEAHRAEAEAHRAEAEAHRAEVAEQRAEAAEQRAEEERQRAERLTAKLRELGIEPDAL